MSKSQKAISIRRHEVKRLKRIGLSNSLISEKLSVGVRTVERDLAWWRERHSELCRSIYIPELIGETLSVYAEIEGRALSEVDEVTSSSDLARLLSVALKSRGELTGFLFRVGTLCSDFEEKKSDELDISTMSSEELEAASKEIRKKIEEVQERLKLYDGPDPLDEYDWN